MPACQRSARRALFRHPWESAQRAELRTLATSKGKRLWQSESGPLSVTLEGDAEAALFMAGRIITDLRDLQAEAWVDWQVGDPSRNWASFTLNDSQRSFVAAQALLHARGVQPLHPARRGVRGREQPRHGRRRERRRAHARARRA
jgi:hypothetical protein